MICVILKEVKQVRALGGVGIIIVMGVSLLRIFLVDGDGPDDDQAKGSHPERKVQFFLTLFKRGGGGANPCSKIMSEIVVCSGGHLTT